MSTTAVDAMLEMFLIVHSMDKGTAPLCPGLCVNRKSLLCFESFWWMTMRWQEPLIREALQQHSEWVVVGEAGDGRQALEKFSDHRPQLTVMDFLMPEMNGLEAARQLTERNPDALILMITTDPSSQLEEEAKHAGIKGLCAKDKMQSLASAIDTVIHGGTYFREDVAA